MQNGPEEKPVVNEDDDELSPAELDDVAGGATQPGWIEHGVYKPE